MVQKRRWKNRLRSSGLSMTCIIILVVISLISLFAYAVIPDNTTSGNRQIPQIALEAPGYNQSFFLKKRIVNTSQQWILGQLANGRHDDVEYVPFDSILVGEGSVTTIFRSVRRDHNILSNSGPIKQIKQYFWLGTDKYGRDVLSRLILGLRISLVVGLFSVLVSLTIGVIVGSVAGYYGGEIDKYLMLVINTSWSIPTLLMAFAIIIAFGKGFLVIILAVGLTMWVDVARVVRGQVLQIKNELFIRASKILGYNDFKIIMRHILPNVIGSILVMAAANFATAILVEAGLSYLGLGIQPPTPSLGNMLQQSYAYATGGFVYLAFFPILTIMTLVLCFNLLGTALRDVFDIKTEELS